MFEQTWHSRLSPASFASGLGAGEAGFAGSWSGQSLQAWVQWKQCFQAGRKNHENWADLEAGQSAQAQGECHAVRSWEECLLRPGRAE